MWKLKRGMRESKLFDTRIYPMVRLATNKEKFLGENFPRKPKILFLGGVRFFYLSPEIFGPFESPPKPNWFSQISGHPAAS